MARPPPQRPPPPGGPGGGGSGSGERGGYGDPRARLDTNGYSQSQRSVSAGQQVPSAQYLQQQQAARRPPPGAYPPQHAPRGDSVRADSLRGPAPQGFYNNASRSPAQAYYNQPGGRPAPALNSDPYRSQSLASVPRPQMYQGATSQQSPANAFRQAQYNGSSARTTAQGRVVPERHEDRAMSMTGYPSYDRDAHQTPSGRVIPNRRAPGSSPDHGPTPSLSGGYPAAYAGSGSQSGRTVSITSTTTVDVNGRTMSMASTIAPSIAPTERNEDGTLVHRYSGGASSMTGERPVTVKIRMPLVYPALLSRVAETFRRKIVVGDRTKNELTYKNAFSGAEAVDVLSYIIRTTDRNLALLLGRALDAQKFFHDVTYEHRLRDSTYEMYQFRETLTDDEKPAVNGVFVLLSECYSPTCTPDQLCYSIACPRRLEQMSKLNLKGGAGLKQEGKAAVNDDDVDQTDEQKLWINSVPKEIADSIGDKEKKRQEVISEICYTERDFVKDLEYLRDFWIYPLKGKINGHSPIPLQRRERVVRTIFTNIIDPPSIHGVSSRFAKSLTERQQKTPVVQNIGDIFMEFVPQFEPFILYGAKQLEGKFEFENERSINKDFARFVDEVERRRESRKLELNGYLTKPTTRLARYPLLLENVLKYTEDGNSDKEDLPKVLVMIRDLLSRVNAESGKAENRFNLRRLHEQLKFRPNDKMDLKLTDEGRELVYKAQFKKSPTENADLTAFLFDHAVLLVKIKQVGKTEEIKAYRRPIPLELLSIKEMEEIIPSGAPKRTSSSLLPALRTTTDAKKGDGWPITFRHLGKNGYELTVYASNQAGRQKWLEFIDTAQQQLRARADFLNTTIISYGYFAGPNKVNCATPFGKCFRMVNLSKRDGVLTTLQMVEGRSSMVRTRASLSPTVRPRKYHQSALSTCKMSPRSMCWKSTRYCWCFPTSPCTRTNWMRSTPTSRSRRSVARRSKVTATSSRLVSALDAISCAPSRVPRCQPQSRCTSRTTPCQAPRNKGVSARCSTPARTNYGHSRSSTFPRNPHRYTSSSPSSALHAPVASRLSVSRHWRRSPFSIRPTHRSTLSRERKPSNQSTSSVSTASSCSTTASSRSLSTATAGGRVPSGVWTGRAHHRPLHSATLGYWRSSPTLSSSGTSITSPCISYRTRTSGCCTAARMR